MTCLIIALHVSRPDRSSENELKRQVLFPWAENSNSWWVLRFFPPIPEYMTGCNLGLITRLNFHFRVLPNPLKGWGVCYHVYVIGAHKRTHVDCQNMPNHCTSIYHEWMCVCVWQQWGWLLLGILHKMWCGPVCFPGSWSGRGWLPLILVWHRIVVGLSCSYCKAQLIGTRCSS